MMHTLQRPTTTPFELAARAVNGNQSATRRLLRAVAPGVRGAIRSLLGARHPDLDDAIQVALIAFVRALPAYRGDSDPLGYARAIAVRTALATKKRERLARSRHDGEAELDRLASSRPSPIDDADGSERQRLMHDLVAELPLEQSTALAMRVGLGLSLADIGRETHTPVNTVRSRLRLAKQRLRERIESDAVLRDAFRREDR
jgi:RNA polymerase sigma-70 factor (ECF subfamily)